MNKNELWKLYCAKEKQVEKARTKRAVKTIMFFAIVFFLWIYFTEEPTGFDIIGDFLASVVFAGIHFVVNSVIFFQLDDMSAGERRMLEELKKRIDEAE